MQAGARREEGRGLVCLPRELFGSHVRPDSAMKTTVKVVSVNARPGQEVAEGDLLFELEIDKAVFQVEAPCTGTIAEVNPALAPGAELELEGSEDCLFLARIECSTSHRGE